MSHPSARRDSTEDNSSSSSSSDSNSNSGSNANAGSKSKWHTALDSYSKGVQVWFRDSNESRWFTATLVHREIDESLDRIRFVFERDLPPSLPQHSHVVPTSGVPSSGTSASADAMSLSSSGSFRSVVERSATISTISSPPAASKPSSAVIGRSAAYSSDTIGPDGKGSDDSSTIVFEATFAEIFDSKAKELPYLHNPSVLDGVEDLTNLSHLNEPAVLYNLQERYRRKEIYTYSGVVLVAMNPFTPVPLYSENIMKRYAGKHRSERPPHLFAIAEDAYHGMVLEGKNQTIIVYGESGAGKTTSAKYIMRYYAQAHHAETNDSSMTRVERQILATNPVLESFGNAKTIRNDNSSRFGKYIEIKFGRDRTSIVGAWIRTFLLERSRVAYQPFMERNYHVFYQLLSCRDEIDPSLGLSDKRAADFHYLSQGGEDSMHIKGVNDGEEFKATRNALALVGIGPEKQEEIWRVLAALLHLGNITISSLQGSAVCADNIAFAKATELLGVDPHQFRQWLIKKRLVTRRDVIQTSLNATQAVVVRDSVAKFIYARLFDWILRPINESLLPTSAAQEASSFIGVLDIYGFEYSENNSFEQFCINFANEKLQQHFNHHVFRIEQQEYAREQLKDWTFIDFKDNQPCIDLIEGKPISILSLLDEESRLESATDRSFIDKLYHQFNREPPTTTWSKATIARNKLLELQQQSKPNPGKPDLSLVSSFFSKPRFSNEAFTIKHYACDVTYESEGFLEKNRDTVPDEIMELLRKSSFPLISELVDVSALDQQKPPGGPSAPSSSTTASSTSHTLTGTLTGSAPKFSRLASVRAMFEGNGDPATTSTTGTGGKPTAAELHSGTTGKAPGAHPRKQAPTLAMVFKHSLNQLMDTLAATDMHYIRCVKPNSAKEAWGFEPDLVLNQLRSCGVIETIRISKAGYPSRMPIRAFNERYEILIPEDERVLVRGQRQKDPPGPAEECAARAQRHQSVIIDGTAWTRFNTRKSVFTDQSEDGADAGVKSKDTVPRDAEDPVTSPSAPTSPEVSQDERDLCVQIVERTIKDKDKYQIGISKIFFRAGQWAVLEQLRTELLTKSVVVLQKYIRSYQARRKLEEYRKAVILIQEWYRRHRICKQILNLGRQRIAVRQIEHAWLGFAQRRRYLAARQAFIKMQAVTKGVLDRRVFNERRAKFEAERLRRIEEMKEEERRMLEVQKAAEEAERQEELEKAAIEEEKKKKEKEELEKIERRAIEAATPEMAADTTGSNTEERPVDTGGGSEYVQDTRTGQDSHNKDERARVAKAEAREIMASVVDALKRQAEANMSTVMPMPSHPEKLPSPVSMRTVAKSPVKEPPPPPDDLPAQEITSDSGNSRTSREQSSRPKQRVVFAEGHMEYLHAMQVEEDERNRKKLVQQQRIQASQERRELERRAAEAEAELEELLKLKELRRNGSIEMLSSQRPLWEHDKTLAAGDQKFTPRKSNISASRLRQPSSGRSGILEETAPIPRSYTEGKIKLPSIVRFSMVEESSTALSRIPSPPSHVANRRRVMEEARQNLLRAGASPTRDEFGVPSSMDSRLMSGLVHGGDKNGLYRDRSQSDLARLSTSSLLAPKTSLTKQRPKDQGLDHGWDTRAPKRYSLRPPAQGDGSSPKSRKPNGLARIEESSPDHVHTVRIQQEPSGFHDYTLDQSMLQRGYEMFSSGRSPSNHRHSVAVSPSSQTDQYNAILPDDVEYARHTKARAVYHESKIPRSPHVRALSPTNAAGLISPSLVVGGHHTRMPSNISSLSSGSADSTSYSHLGASLIYTPSPSRRHTQQRTNGSASPVSVRGHAQFRELPSPTRSQIPKLSASSSARHLA